MIKAGSIYDLKRFLKLFANVFKSFSLGEGLANIFWKVSKFVNSFNCFEKEFI